MRRRPQRRCAAPVGSSAEGRGSSALRGATCQQAPVPPPQVRALQLRLHELEQGGKADVSRGQSGQAGTDAAGGEGACSQADLQHVLAHSHKMAAEMRAYGQVAAVEREGRVGTAQPCLQASAALHQHRSLTPCPTPYRRLMSCSGRCGRWRRSGRAWCVTCSSRRSSKRSLPGTASARRARSAAPAPRSPRWRRGWSAWLPTMSRREAGRAPLRDSAVSVQREAEGECLPLSCSASPPRRTDRPQEKTALEQQLRAQLADATAETNSLRR